MNTPEWLLINKDAFSSIRLRQTTEWLLPLDVTVNPKTNVLNTCQQCIPSHAPGKRLAFSHCSDKVTHTTLLYSEFLPSSLHAVISESFPLSGSPLSHSSLGILCSGTVCSPELHLFSVKWLEQGEWAAFIPAALCAELYTKRQQITTDKKKNYARISLLTSFKTLFFITHVIKLHILTEVLDIFSNDC